MVTIPLLLLTNQASLPPPFKYLLWSWSQRTTALLPFFFLFSNEIHESHIFQPPLGICGGIEVWLAAVCCELFLIWLEEILIFKAVVCYTLPEDRLKKLLPYTCKTPVPSWWCKELHTWTLEAHSIYNTINWFVYQYLAILYKDWSLSGQNLFFFFMEHGDPHLASINPQLTTSIILPEFQLFDLTTILYSLLSSLAWVSHQFLLFWVASGLNILFPKPD